MQASSAAACSSSGVKTDRLGLRHAHLVSAADLTQRKTLSLRALADPSRFEEV
jgi:hypothetical protein